MSSQKLNIVYIGRYNDSEILSGPEKTAKRIFAECSKQHNPLFIQYFFDGTKYGFIRKLFGYESKNNIITVGLIKLFFLLFRLNPGIIHIITFERFAYIAVLYSFFKKVKVIYNSHGVIKYEDTVLKKEKAFHRFKNRYVEKSLLNNADVIIFNSETSKYLCGKYYTLDNKKCLIIPNGVDKIFNICGDGRREGYVFFAGGKLHESSRMFLKKFLDYTHSQLDIHVIGSNKFCVNIIKSNIKIFDKMSAEKLAEFYKDKDIFLCLNSYDTFSIATAEAMSAGLIPITTKETGMSSYIKNGENGFIVNYGDTRQLENIIMLLCNMDSAEKDRIRRNTQNIYKEISWDKVYNMYDNIYHIIGK